jgi:large subunit ribosomal protein L4
VAVKAKKIDAAGNSLGDVTLPEAVFGIRPKEHLLFDAVTMQLASRRQGTAKTKGRAEVRGGGKKPYKQKGTGNARQGTSRSPLMPGGGTTFGPTPRSYTYRIPREARRQALSGALSQKAHEGKVFVLEGFDLKTPKTSVLAKAFARIEASGLLVVGTGSEVLRKSVRNIARTKYLDVAGLNVFDVLKYEKLLLTPESLTKIEERLVSA